MLLCEWCGVHPATERHHCLIHRRKGITALDDDRNIMLVCRTCHSSGVVNGRPARVKFWKSQCKKYGERNMRDWYDSLPLKIKERFD